MKLTKAVTHIKIQEANPGKLAALDALAQAYMLLCQQYVTLFCTDRQPDKFATSLFRSPLSQRWQRVAIQQAAGIAQSWRTIRSHSDSTRSASRWRRRRHCQLYHHLNRQTLRHISW